MLHRLFVFAGFGFLTLGGTLHFVVDVLAQYVRDKRIPGPETTLYFGMNTAYALGQIVVGVLGLLAAHEAPRLFSRWPALALTLGAALSWLTLSFVFIEYREPRMAMGVFASLAIGIAVTA